MKKQLTKRAAFDGIIRAAALFLLIDFASSSCFAPSAYSVYFAWTAAASIAAGLLLPAVLAFLSFRKYRTEFKPGKYFLVSTAAFVLMLLLIFLNYLTLHLRLFPLRELADTDGGTILLVFASFIILNLIGRAFTFAVICFKQKSNRYLEQPHE